MIYTRGKWRNITQGPAHTWNYIARGLRSSPCPPLLPRKLGKIYFKTKMWEGYCGAPFFEKQFTNKSKFDLSGDASCRQNPILKNLMKGAPAWTYFVWILYPYMCLFSGGGAIWKLSVYNLVSSILKAA